MNETVISGCFAPEFLSELLEGVQKQWHVLQKQM